MSKPNFSSLFSVSPKEYASRFSQSIKKAGSGKAEKSNDANKKCSVGDADAADQVSLVSPLKIARSKKEKLRGFSEVRSVPDGPTAKRASSHSKRLLEAGADMKSAQPKSGAQKDNSFLKKLRNFLQKNVANLAEHSDVTGTVTCTIHPSKKVRFQLKEQSAGSSRTSSSTTGAARPGGKESITGSGDSELSQLKKIDYVDAFLEVSELRKTDDIDRCLDELEQGLSSGDAEGSSAVSMDGLLSRIKDEVEDINKFLAGSAENKDGGRKSGIVQEELTAFIQKADQALKEKKNLSSGLGKDSGGRRVEKALDDLKALHEEVQHDLEGWERLSSQLEGTVAGDRNIGAALDEMKARTEELEKDLERWDELVAQRDDKDWAKNYARLKLEQKKDMELQISRELEEVQKMLAAGGRKVESGKPGSGSK